MNNKIRKLVIVLMLCAAVTTLFAPTALATGTGMTSEEYYTDAMVLYEQGDYEEAITALDQAIRLYPDDDLYYYMKGLCLYQLERYEEALPVFDKAIAIDTEASAYYFNKANCFFMLDKYEEAITMINKSIEIDPDVADYYYNKAVFLYYMGRYQEAKKILDQAIQLEPSDPQYIEFRDHLAICNMTASPASAVVVINGSKISFDAYNINGNNYFKLRDLAMALNSTEKKFSVDWDSTLNAIKLTSGNAYTPIGGELAPSGSTGSKPASLSTSTVYIDGTEVSLTAYKIGDSNYFKLRDLGQAFDFSVTWDSSTSTIKIDTSSKYSE